MENDMRPAIIPKSDQLNTDDLLGGPIIITINKVSISPGIEQPVLIHYSGDNGKPYKPCKSMCRVMVSLWGSDANQYVGRSMTLYADPKVLWGGMAVGGIRISHMSHIAESTTMALTATKGSRKPYTVKPLAEKIVKSDRETSSAAHGSEIDNTALLADADAAAAKGMDAYAAFWKSITKEQRHALATGHDERKALALHADSHKGVRSAMSNAAAEALSVLQSCKTEVDLDAIWQDLDIDVCRELGADRLEELRNKLTDQRKIL